MEPSGKNGLGDERELVEAMNRVSSDAPSTISGVDIGRKMSRFVAARPRNPWRTRASAISVPRIVATIVDERTR